MLNTVSWSQYWLCIFLALLLYYSYVWLRFFWPMQRGNFPGTSNAGDEVQAMSLPAGREIYAFLEQARYEKLVRSEIIYGLQQILRRHELSPQSADVSGLTQWFLILCKDKCAVSLSDEDIKQVWLV